MRDRFVRLAGLAHLEADSGAGAGGAGTGGTGDNAPAGAAAPASTAATTAAAVDLVPVRDLVIRAYPNAIPEMIVGDTIEQLLASAEASTAVHERIASAAREQQAAATTQPPRVSAGGGQRQFVINVEELSPSAKIAEGLRQRARRA